MVLTPPEMRALIHDMAVSVWSLGAIGALFEAGIVEQLREPRSLDDLTARCRSLSRERLERCLAVAASSGIVVHEGGQYRLAPGAMAFTEPPMRGAMHGEIRTTLMQTLALLDSSGGKEPVAGWRHTDRALLQSQGDGSAGFAPMFKANVIGGLGDLAARLDRQGARFLDVGVGVASLSIAMCRAWPELRVVGLDTFDVPLAIARENVARANLADRIELRKLAVQDLTDEASFDLAWLPAIFIPDVVVKEAAARVRASLRPGGWVLLPVMGATGEEKARAVWGLINELWGGAAFSVADAEGLLKGAGFTTLRSLPGPAWAPVLIVAQR